MGAGANQNDLGIGVPEHMHPVASGGGSAAAPPVHHAKRQIQQPRDTARNQGFPQSNTHS